MNEAGDATESSLWAETDPAVLRHQSRALVEAIDGEVVRLDATGEVVAVNDAAIERLGYGRDDLVGEHISMLLDSAAADQVEGVLGDSDAAAGVTTLDVSVQTATGDATPRELRVSPVTVERDRQGAVVVARDIAGRKTGVPERTAADRTSDERPHGRTLENIFEASPIGISALTPDGEVIAVNDRAAEIFGNAPDEAIEGYDATGWQLYDAAGDPIPTEDRAFGRVVETGEPVTDFEAQVEREDGDRMWLSFDAAPVFDSADELSMVVVTYEDITERKGLEQEKQELQTELREILGRISDAFIALDEDFRFTHINDQAHELINPEGKDLLGENIWEKFPAASERRFKPKYEHAMNAQETVSFEEHYPDPLDAWFEVRAYPSETGLSVYFRDITERKNAEQELKEHKKQLEASINAGAIGTWEWHIPEDRFVAGASLARKFGVDPESAREGVSLDRLVDSIHEEDRDRVEAAIQEAIETCGEYECEYRVRNADGELRWVVARGHVESDEDGNPVTFPGALTDITQRKRTEQELEASEQRYRALAENFPNGIVTLFNTDYEYTLAAGQAFDSLSVDADDLKGQHYRDVWNEESACRLEPLIEATIEDGEQRSTEIEHAGREWVLYTIPITDDEGEVFAGMTMAQDITERKEHEAELAKYETIVETINDGIYVVEDDGQYTMVNDAYTELTGYDRENLIGSNASRIVTGDTLERAAEIRAEMETDDVTNPTMETTIETADGDDRPVEVTFASLPSSDGGERVGVVRDISRRVEQRRKIEESERRYRTLVENFPNGAVGLFDDDLRYTAVGGRLVERSEGDTDERVGSRIPDIYPDDLTDEIEPYFRAALDGETNSFEVEFQGSHLSAYTLPIEDAEGNVDTGMLVVQDITDRKEIEQELRESEARFRMLAENLEEIVWMSTPDTEEMLYINPTYEEVWGRSRDELYERSQSFIDAVHPDDRERVRDAYTNLPDEEYDEEFRVVQPDGEIRWVHARGAPVSDDRGEVFRVVGIAEDITERKEHEQALEKSERRYRTLAEHFPNGAVGVYDQDLRYTLAEGRVLGDHLPPANKLEGQQIMDLFPAGTISDLEPLFRAAVEDGETGSTTTALNDRTWKVWATPLRDANGEIFAGLSFTQDITEQVEREQKLEELVQRLEESNERLEQFAYAASHDLQEPLRMVSSYLSLIERRYEDNLDEEGLEFLEFAVDGAERMREMIDALLKYSRVETRGDPFEPVELEDIVADARMDLQMKIEETDADVTVGSLPKILGDKDQLRQVFQNLLDNALEYSGDEPPVVTVSAEQDGDEWIVSVHDEGIGVEPDQTDNIFEVFQRLHTQEEHAGTGIGLALCRRIIERHDGEIWVESELEKGSTFKFTLPTMEATND